MTDIWTEQELDNALRELHADEPAMTDVAWLRGRRRLQSAMSLVAPAGAEPSTAEPSTVALAAAGRRRPSIHRYAPWLVGAAAAGVVIVAVTMLPGAAGLLDSPAGSSSLPLTSPPANEGPPTGTPTSSATRSTPLPPIADAPINSAGDLAARVSDPQRAPGQYLYVGKRSVLHDTRYSGGQFVVGSRTASWEEWIPVDRNGEWMLRRDDDVDNDDMPPSEPPGGPPNMEGEFRALAGDYYANIGGMNPGNTDFWLGPSEAFVAGLPRDPRALYEQLRTDAMTFGNPAREAFVLATTVLTDAGALPADLRAALYQALGYLPYLNVTEGARTSDGRDAVTLSIQNEFARMELLVDPVDGQVIGQREVALIDHAGRRAGDLITDTTITYGVVDAMGQLPG